MVSDTNTKKKNRAHRSWPRLLSPAAPELKDIDRLLDFYWGGPERRITGLTVRIIAVNTLALFMLLIGVIFMGQYQSRLIEAKLETFKTQVDLISSALSETAATHEKEGFAIDVTTARKVTGRLSAMMNQQILVYDNRGMLAIDSDTLDKTKYRVPTTFKPNEPGELYSVRVLKDMAGFIISIFPDRTALPLYQARDPANIKAYPDAVTALNGEVSMTAWSTPDESIFLTAAAPISQNNTILGAVLLKRPSNDIKTDIHDVWLNMICIFIMTLFVTIFVSIYLAGTIGNPLRRLAKAAEKVRHGAVKDANIPDFSDRHDEIGELSVVLRDMTAALYNRMDLIERFAADVAHELKNPITSMRSAVETALIVKKQKDREKLMDILKHDIDRLDRLVTDISSASRLDSELSRQPFEKIDIRKIIFHLMDMHGAAITRSENQKQTHEKTVTTQNNVTISFQVQQDQDLSAWGLEGRLEQVFDNILSNALSFSTAGQTVTIRAESTKSLVRIFITDQGPGIPENKLETIFERFYSERPEHESYGQHSGLGLSICKQIIDAHGGHISAENIKTETGTSGGARFTVILKAA